jgi:2-polyprenyl-6-methoxyphenol hydroxylase-like FAD-dependent oxidoreductase
MALAETRPVLIVGAGPTGMTAAMELARFGIPVRLVEKAPEPATTSRAIGVQARTLELFEQRGLAEAMLEIGNKGLAGSAYGGGRRLFHLDFSHIDSRYRYVLLISQAETERILREELARRGVSVERGVELIAFAQADSHAQPGRSGGVSAILRHGDGTLEELDASYLIDAEGAHSIVRTSLGLEFRGKALDYDYALGDLDVDGDLPNTDFHIFTSAHGFMVLFPLGGRHFRLIASDPLTKPGASRGPSLDELQQIYDMRSHIPARLRDMRWGSWFRINSRMTDKMMVGRIFLGGDAAHIHSPAGAQGMNTGIQDMINLGWKLAMVIQGKAAPDLLSTYEEDRLPVIRDVLTKTEALTDAVGSENALFRTLFAHIAPLVVGTEFVQDRGTAHMSQVSLHYRDSSLSETDSHHGSLRAGDRIPDMTVNAIGAGDAAGMATPRSERLFRLLNPSMVTLLYANVADPAEWHRRIREGLGEWPDFLRSHRIAPVEEPGEHAHFLDGFGGKPAVVLVRPDDYIGFLGGESSVPKLVNYLKKWFP